MSTSGTGMSKSQWAMIGGLAAAGALALWYLTRGDNDAEPAETKAASASAATPRPSPTSTASDVPRAPAAAKHGDGAAPAAISAAGSPAGASPAASSYAGDDVGSGGGASGGAGSRGGADGEEGPVIVDASSSGAGSASPAGGDGEDGEVVSRDMLVDLLQKIVVGAQSILVQLANTQSDMSQEELSANFLAQVQEYEKQIYADAGVVGADVEAATERYASDEQVHVLGQQLHKLCNAISQPTQLPAVPDTMTPEAFISAFKAYMGAVNQCFDDALDVAIKSGRTGRELLMTVNTEVMGSAARESQEAVLREHGLTEPLFQAALHKYQDLDEVKTLLEALQRHQQEQLKRVLGDPEEAPPST